MLKLLRIFVILALLGIVGFTVYNVVFNRPEVFNLEELRYLPKKKEVALLIKPRSYVNEVEVLVLQGEKEVTLFRGKLPKNTNEIKFVVEPRKVGLSEGPALVKVYVRRLFLLRDVHEIRSTVDTRPPEVNIAFAPYMVIQGGSGGIKITTNEPVEARVRVGKREFKFRELKENTYIALFGVPVKISTREPITVVAYDRAGNKTVVVLGTGIRRNRFKKIRVELSRLEKKLRPKLESMLGEEGLDFVTLFRKVNEELREKNEERIRLIGGASVNKRLWKGRFLQLKRSKVLSKFGEERIYYYRGKEISRSLHLGYDLASVKNAPVPASNSGEVVFAGDLGIYGNTVIIDHGFGLMSLYAHLASFNVKKGDMVKKGQIIGRTDSTGLAFGDHLHFAILIDGFEVTPLEWWDPKWVKTRIEPLFED